MKSFIPKPILRASFQKQLAQDQSKTDTHSINPINLNGIRFSFVWKLGSENFHSSKHGCHPVILREAVRERGGEKLIGGIKFKIRPGIFSRGAFHSPGRTCHHSSLSRRCCKDPKLWV